MSREKMRFFRKILHSGAYVRIGAKCSVNSQNEYESFCELTAWTKQLFGCRGEFGAGALRGN